MKRQAINQDVLSQEIYEKIKLWILRILDKINRYKILSKTDYHDYKEDINNRLNLQKSNLDEIDKNFLQEMLKKYEKKRIKTYEILSINLDMVCKTFGFGKTERDILEFAILVNVFNENIEEFLRTEYIGGIATPVNLPFLLEKILNLDTNEVSKALLKLTQSFILNIDYRELCDTFEFQDKEFPMAMLKSINTIEKLFANVFQKCDFSNLVFDDFSYLKINTALLTQYISKNLQGTNILIYGTPGTGKTEFAKVVAKALNKSLYEIGYGEKLRHSNNWNWTNGRNSVKGDDRFRLLRLADNILKSSNALIMFDEVEDIFNEKDISKAMINRTLESNTVPTIWISNNIDNIDNAYIRRFDMVFEFIIPPKHKRFEFIKRYSDNQISDKMAKKLSKINLISPGLISKATKVILNSNPADKDNAFKNNIFCNLKAQCGIDFDKKKKKKKKDEIKLPQIYGLEYINAGLNLQNLTKGIQANPNARICIYGPAGTGKSAFAKFLAKKLDKKLIIKKGSDLLNAYVGGTEQNIAMAFKEAKKQKAVLVFDEVDTFLQDRSVAQRSWEISQTNEMLTQMENFDGIFIATTNFMGSLDEACIRRFDMKIKFDFMVSKMALALFEKECENLNLKFSETAKNTILTTPYLTPGDFAAVLRTHKFSPFADANDFATRLQNEVSYKKVQKANAKKIGLV